MSNYQWPIIKETFFDLALYLLIAEFEVRAVNYGHFFFFSHDDTSGIVY